ncbi:MAG: TIGR02206 family membrane protein, partial [Gemmatimonadaceae bacterium]
MNSFRLFGPTHAAALAGLALVIFVLVRTGRTLRGRNQRRFERVIASLVLALWLSYIGWDSLHGSFDISHSLPLQLCDFVALVAGAAFVSRNRVVQALAYFWGLALSTQALITPDVAGGPTSITFAAFWLYHAFVVGAGVYVVAVHDFRPTRRDLLTAQALGVVWAVAVFSLDAMTGWNYGYLGRSRPSIPSLIDHL